MSQSEGAGGPRVLTVVGNRPQFIKAAAVSPHLRPSSREVLVHTGQHFDQELSAVFFAELGLPRPDHQLEVALGSNTSQVSRMMVALEPLVHELSPDLVLVYGDTNSTLAGALVGAQARIPVAHVEAGMRAFDRHLPEEVNRVLTDHLSSLLLCSSETAVAHLRGEGLQQRSMISLVGDVMVDVAMMIQPRARGRADLIAAHGLEPGEYVLATAHRASTVDDPARLRQLVALLGAIPRRVLLAAHPRTRARLEQEGLLEALERRVIVTGPLGYLEFAALLVNALALLTDSGGLQKEAYLAGVPCLTMRPSTEWTETVQAGWNTLVDLDSSAVLAALDGPRPAERPALYGDGQAGMRVAASVAAFCRERAA